MLLIIHNLPKMIRYEEVKDLIRNRCNLTDIIVDNLVLETTLTRKVTIGLTDESDAAIVFKELNGLVLGGRKITVEDVRKKQDSGNRYKPSTHQNNNMTQTQYATYNHSSGGVYSYTGIGTTQNTQIPYRGVPSPFDNNQEPMGGSSASGFISFNSEKSNYDGGKSDRYFDWKGNDQPSDVQGRSNYSNNEKYVVWAPNRSDEYSRRSDAGDTGGSSTRGPYRWVKGDDRRRYNDDAGPSRYDDNSSRQNEGRQRRDDSYDRPAKRPKVSHFEKASARNDFGSGNSAPYRGNQREHGGGSDRGYQNRPVQKPSFKNAPNKTPHSRGQDFKPPRSGANADNKPWNQPKSIPQPKAQKNPDDGAMRNKDETWRGQAVSAIVRDMLTKNGMWTYVKKQFSLNHVKPIVRTRIDKMLGKRFAVPAEQIIAEYKSKEPPFAQTEFIFEERKKYELMRLNERKVSKEKYERTVKQLNAQLESMRRGTNPFQCNNQKKAKPAPKQAKAQPEIVLPRYEGDKRELNKMKRLEKSDPCVYDHKLDPKLKKALDDEVAKFCDIIRQECQKGKDDDEKNICRRILETVESFRQHVNLNVTKRLLNITKTLPLRAYTDGKVNSKEVKEQLKSLGIVTFRKCMGKNKYLATCRTFEQFDHFCGQSEFVINGQRIVFKPLYVARNSKRKMAKQKKNTENVDNEDVNDGDENVDDGDENVDDGDENDGFESDWNEDDEMYEEIFEDDHEDDKKDIEIKHDTKIENNTNKVKSDYEQESKTENVDSKIKTETIEGKTDCTLETDKIEQTEETVNEMDNPETAKLVEDIKALSKTINEENTENDEENTDNDKVNTENIEVNSENGKENIESDEVNTENDEENTENDEENTKNDKVYTENVEENVAIEENQNIPNISQEDLEDF